MPDEFDPTQETLKHIRRVQTLLAEVAARLTQRGIVHDASKLLEPEASVFAAATSKLRGLTYGSQEYHACLADMKPALDHHYQNNSHHPEHFRWHCPVCNLQISDATHATAPEGPNDSGVKYCPSCCRMGMIYETGLMLKPQLGITGMSLLDVVEMFCDWKAATERHANGDLSKSFDVNGPRFGIAPQLIEIFRNTKTELGW